MGRGRGSLARQVLPFGHPCPGLGGHSGQLTDPRSLEATWKPLVVLHKWPCVLMIPTLGGQWV